MMKISLKEKIELTPWLLLISLSGASFILLPDRFTLGILCGGMISGINFVGLKRDIQIFLNGGGKKKLILRFYLRLTAIGLLLYLLISREAVDIFALLLGLSLVVISFAVVLFTERKNVLQES